MQKIIRPTLIVDKKKVIGNIQRFVEKTLKHNLEFRPHFKTHQSHEIGSLFREQGVTKITVATLDMAAYFSEDGWQDITVAFPVNILEADTINQLASKIKLNLLLENLDAAKQLDQVLSNPVNIYLKTNIGYNRAGIRPENYPLMDDILQIISDSTNMNFEGFLVHSGHTYNAVNTKEIINIHEKTLKDLAQLKAYYTPEYPDLKISLGDTPACSICDTFEGVDEIRPGNFVLFDAMQYNLNTCSLEDIAIIMAAPITSKYEDRNEILVYCGADHLSKDYIVTNDHKTFGYLARLTNDGWIPLETTNFVKSLSQFHGILKVSSEVFESINIGDVVGIIPIHSCLTANIMKNYKTTEGEIIEMMPWIKS